MALSAEALAVLRLVHLVAAVVWFGTIYFANFLIGPLIESLPSEERPRFVVTVFPRFLAFRHAAWITILAGFVLVYGLHWQYGDIVESDGAKTVFSGMVLGVVMLALVWFVIAPNLQAIVHAVRNGVPPPPNAERDSTQASRAVFALSVPLVVLMAASAHFPFDWRGIALVVVLGGAAAMAFLIAFERRSLHGIVAPEVASVESEHTA